MKTIFSLSFLLLSIFFLLGCRQKSSRTSKKSHSNIFSFLKLSQTDSIYITARFSECGEWGGHKEEIIINADERWNTYVHYKVFPYNCDSINFYYSNDNLLPKIDTIINLSDRGKQSIKEYIQRLAQSKVMEEFPGHAGDYFSVVTSDSALIIKVYDDKLSNVDSFNKLVSGLFK
jgi:hypothetical protein